MAKKQLTMALIQMNSSDDKEANCRRAEKMIRLAARKSPDVIIFPECFSFRGKASQKYLNKNVAEKINGPVVNRFKLLAKQFGVHLILGSLYESVAGKSKPYSTAVMISPEGTRMGVYRKKKLFSARIGNKRVCEADVFLPGKRGCTFYIKGFKCGITICYDLRFPLLFQQYARTGSHVIFVPSNFTYETGKDHWEILLRARAIENKCYIVAPNQCGTDNRGIRAYGRSMVVSPWGKVLVCAENDRERILYSKLDVASIEKAKRVLS